MDRARPLAAPVLAQHPQPYLESRKKGGEGPDKGQGTGEDSPPALGERGRTKVSRAFPPTIWCLLTQ